MDINLIDILQQKITLRDKNIVPAFLFGTYKKIDISSIRHALKTGFFSFDMAAIYNTEDLLLNEINNYINIHGWSNCRDKFYFMYKLDFTKLEPEQIQLQADSILNKIFKVFPNVKPYVDLLVIHAPNHKVDIEHTWHTMEYLVEKGKAKALGVSNFNIRHLQCMHTLNLSMPLINQIEVNPFFAQNALVEYCMENNIKISSYRSANNKATPENIEILSEISNNLGLTIMQLINSWKFTKGMQIVAISQDPNHISELTKVVRLEDKYMSILEKLDHDENGRRTCSGAWSSFDFNGITWFDYIQTT